MKLYVYPPKVSAGRNIVNNPYIENLINGFDSTLVDVVNKNSFAHISILDFIKHLFKFDVVIFNWLENIGNRKFGYFQFILFLLSFLVLKIRKVKIVWIMHNIHPHTGETYISSFVKNLLFRHSSLIVTHSKEAKSYAQLRASLPENVLFINHPIKHSTVINNEDSANKDFDLLIWGSIDPYKGVLDFLKYYNSNLSYNSWTIKIVGRCKDPFYEDSINRFVDKKVTFENRIISFEELRIYINRSKFVLFPYLSSSVSSSGALMDTISFHGSIIGPNKGAFLDLSMLNLCSVYDTYEDINHIVNKFPKLSKIDFEKFINDNSWKRFCEIIINHVDFN
ncbi:hypothetical protein [uncultured Algoriphagus sp.]|uniref:hypothetical protein n=1 Tax=uncultured Algoriphagus sp. TaxID=417365 RepID=UPI0030EC361C|tara:strand:+ start:27232 stop:28242 length:1011 start_codon:yes stop_codon:yes gene_type:complete